MPIELELGLPDGSGRLEVTDISSLSISLDMRSGLQTRSPNALEITVTRKVGAIQNAGADQLGFRIMRGKTTEAGVNPVTLKLDLTDGNEDGKSVGLFNAEECFVRQIAVSDAGDRLDETLTIMANNVTYKKSGGPETPPVMVFSGARGR